MISMKYFISNFLKMNSLAMNYENSFGNMNFVGVFVCTAVRACEWVVWQKEDVKELYSSSFTSKLCFVKKEFSPNEANLIVICLMIQHIPTKVCI